MLHWTREGDVHLPLDKRKIVVARFQASRHLHHDLRNSSPQLMEAVGHLFQTAATVSRRRAGDNAPLDKHLQHVAIETERAAAEESLGNPADCEELRDRVQRFNRTALGTHCCNCAGSNPTCRGEESDKHALKAGKCFAFLHDIFNLIVLLTDRTYDDVAAGYVGDGVHITFETTYSSQFQDPTVSFEATTAFGDSGNGRKWSRIELALDVDKFDIGTWLGLFRPVMHEVFVHAPQNLLLAGRRDGHGKECPFSEGFMDAFAEAVLLTTFEAPARGAGEIKQALERLGVYAGLDQVRACVDGKSRNGSLTRVGLPGTGRPEDLAQEVAAGQMYGARERGQDAYRAVTRALGSDYALRIAVKANLAPLTRDQRIAFVETLVALADAGPDSPRRRRRRDRLLAFAREGSPVEVGRFVPSRQPL